MSQRSTIEVRNHPQTIRVAVSDDRMSARVIIPIALPRDAITFDDCCALLENHHVAVNDAVIEQVRQLLSDLPPIGRELYRLVAKGQPVVDGQDGAIEWLVDGIHQLDVDDEEQVNHYERSPFVYVKSGTAFARIIAPTEEHDGWDVSGKPLPAQAGEPVKLDLDSTVTLDDEGQLIANIDGILQRQVNAISIREVMHIDGDIDFATGNIRFGGDVHVQREIVDCDLTVDGTLEVSHGSVAGGRLQLGGPMQVDTLGGASAVETIIALTPEIPVDLLITRQAHPGVRLMLGPRSFYFTEPIRGPLHITRNADGRLVYQQGHTDQQPLCLLPGVAISVR